MQGGMIHPPPGLPLPNLDIEYTAKQRNMMNTSSYFLHDEGQHSEMGMEEDERRRRINSSFKHM
jgi:hypothetical protein